MKTLTSVSPVASGVRTALAGTTLLLAAISQPLYAQQSEPDAAKADQEIEKIVVVGSRGAPRSVGDSAVPVDVIGADEFTKNGPSDMMTLMSAVVPSFNVNTQPINDASTLVRPANLRGLPPDSTLVLLNGKRRHRSAVITFLGGGLSDGSQGPDISVIPSIALKQVEILRDGAAAQYGSDAIAGVINFRLKDADEGGSIELKTGQQYEGDGDLRQISANIGLPFTDNGFANFSTEFKQSDPTNRSIQRGDAAKLNTEGASIPNPAQIWGSPEVKRDLKVFANLGAEVAKEKEFYLFGNFAERDVEGGFYYRNPITRSGVYGRTDEGPDANGDGKPDYKHEYLLFGNMNPALGACPAVRSENLTFAQAQQAVAGLPAHCVSFMSLLPNGFTPKFGGIVTDASLAGGLKGTLENGWNFDLSGSYGRSEVEFYLKGTINPSLGLSTPRDFKTGKYVQQEQALNYDMNKLIEIDALPYPLAVAGGLEYRIDTFEIYAGDKNSFAVGPLASQGFGIGSNGFPGFKPDDAGSFNRYNYAAYAEFGAEFSDNLRSDFAVRYEDYEDFGSTTNAKLTGRYQMNDALALRAALSTGFRAPTIGQSMVRNVTTSFAAGKGLVDTATLPPTHPISVLKGGKALTPEESVNLSFGTVLEIDDLYATLDFYQIKVTDRISQSSSKDLTADDIRQLQALGVSDASSFSQVKFFTNDFDTTTQGVDLVVNYNLDQFGGRTSYALAMNFNQTTVDSVSSNISEAKVKQIEEGLPRMRGSFTISHNHGDWTGYVRLNHYGKYYEDHADSGFVRPEDDGLPLYPGSEMTVDAEVSYIFNDSYTVAVGASNLLDEYPDENRWAGALGAQYPTTSVMGFNGGFYYARLTYNF